MGCSDAKKSRWILFALFLSFIVLTISCGGEASENANPPEPPPAGETSPSTTAAQNVTELYATLTGIFTNPNGYTTTVFFEWGTSASYGNSTPPHYYATLGRIIVSADLTGLQPNTTYHYRLVTQNTDGTFYGNDMTFTTITGLATITVLATGLTNPQNIAIGNGYIYWTEGVDSNGSATNGSVMMASLTSRTSMTLKTNLNSPFGIAVDANNVFWTEQNGQDGGRVMMMPLASGAPATMLAGGLHTPQFIAVSGWYVYFTELGTWNDNAKMRNSDGTVNRIPMTGGTVETLASGLSEPQTILVDSFNVYWTEVANYVDGAGSVKMVPINGGAVTTLVDGLSGSQYIAANNTSVYYWAGWGTLQKVSISDGMAVEIASSMNGTPPLALDSSFVYWTENYYGGLLKKVGINGGPVTVMAAGLSNAANIAIDDVHVYWMEASTFNSSSNTWNSDGCVKAISKP